ncbi:glycine betaine ABC transporter substrate-binding protein [Neptunomonas antarctica]|uniref:Glycine betaine/proline transport system substrate-binding protein n=1 Tax=Neptunomonas antarctica TaxID=619304 RepID=A0A1N7L183_9GAMM|nr:glycine betaine ABC transporter substrate-binding protein [Neptunomonas antarctica]SIS67574.1 glycine betaine/proline transport system substrate-binding protein [Neptunomonas antarctica]
MKTIKALSAAVVLSLTGGLAQAADVVVGVPAWPSAAATAYILKVVMEDNLGLDVAMQSGSNAVIFEAMDRGSLHVHPEVWLPNQQNLHDKYVNENGTVVQNQNGVEAAQGICITKATSEKYNITSIYDLSDPDKSVLFDTDGDGKGEMWVGQPGAASTTVEIIKAKSYGYAETMNLVELDTPLNWAALDAAVKADKPYAFFCYTPHHVFAMHELVFLKEPAHNPDTWKVLQPTDSPDWLAESNADSAWDSAYLYVHYAKSLEKDQPEAAMLLKNFKLNADLVGQLSYSMVVDKKDPETLAHEWVLEHSDLVESWLGQ